MSLDLLTYRARPPADEAAGALVIMHGRGADEHDLEPLAHELDPERRLAVFLPRGPLSLPPGGAHWYVLREVGSPDPPTFTATFDRLTRWVDAALESAGVTSDRLVVAGFSQGSVMAYSLGLAAARPRPGAILAFSGFIPSVPGFDLDLASRLGMPVSITHGTLDAIIGVEFGREARKRLTAAGLDVRYREEPVGHGITPAALEQARATLIDALS
ncbi:MAG: phospholipase [Actinomycetota bacterium]|nr:phospholipase [Actinomycetota bacterium]